MQKQDISSELSNSHPSATANKARRLKNQIRGRVIKPTGISFVTKYEILHPTAVSEQFPHQGCS